MTKTHYLFLLLFLIPFLGKAQNWKPLGPDDFNQPGAGNIQTASISDGTNNVYIASVYGNNKIIIKEFEAGKWKTVSDAAFSENYTQYPKIVFNGSIPYVAYGDQGNNTKLTVKKYNGSNWELVGAAGFSGDNLQAVDLAFNGVDPYVVYTDGTSSRKLIVKQYNGTDWVAVGSNDVSDIYAVKPGIALDGATPYVVYNDGSDNGKLKAKKYDGSNWVALGDIGLSNVDINSLVINNGTPYVMYSGWSNNDKLTVQKFDGTNWAPVGIDVFTERITGAEINFDGSTPYVIYKTDDYMDPKAVVKKLKADASGWETVGDLGLLEGNSMGGGPGAQDPVAISFINAVPFAFYLEGDYDKKVIVKQFNGTDWLNLGGSAISAGRSGLLSVASDGVFPYVAYQDGANSNKATVKKYNGAIWETVGPVGFSAGSVSGNMTLSFDAVFTPYLAYGDDASGGKLTVQRYTGSSWETVGSSSVSSGYADDNMLAFNGNIPYVVYKDGNQSRLSVKKINSATNNWEIVGNPDFSETFPGYPSIAFNEGIPYVAYLEGGSIHRITVKKLNGNTWEVVGNTDFTQSQSYNSQIAFDNGRAYIIYTDGGNGNKATVRIYNATTNKWELVGSVVSSAGAGSPKLIFVDHTPYVAYADNSNGGKLTVKKFNGNEWETVGDPNVSAGSVGQVGITNVGGKLVTGYTVSDKAFAKSYLLYTPTVAVNSTIYVTENGAGTKDGSSWANATNDLQKAMLKSTENVYVAAGTYNPIYSANTDFSVGYDIDVDNRNNAFVLVKEVKVYGGFNADAPEASPELRDTTASSTNKSILSGDFNGNDPNEIDVSDGANSDKFGDNAYHVVISTGAMGTATLNGFTITGGVAMSPDGNMDIEDPTAMITVNGVEVPIFFGGGIVTASSNPTLNNLVLSKNIALAGAGVAVIEGNPLLTNVNINRNYALIGGGILNYINSNPILTNVSITKNFGQGGGMLNALSSPIMTNVTITGNGDGSTENGIINQESSNPQIRNSIIDGIVNDETSVPIISYSLISGSAGSGNNWIAETGTDGGNNLDTNPMFSDAANGNFTLQAGSPAINAGSDIFYTVGGTPSLNGITSDITGNIRFNGTIDMGAYEYEGVLPVSLTSFAAKAETAGARLTWQTASEQNNKAFSISRSTDGINFTAIGTVESKGNSNSPTNYTFLDLSLSTGTNYYRLNQMDIDGKITDLGTRSVNFQLASVQLSVYPNPTTDLANVKFKAGVFNNTTLLDLTGKVLAQQAISAEQDEACFNLSSYKSGTYIILLRSKQKLEVLKVIKL